MRIYTDSCIAIYQVEAVTPWFVAVDSAMRVHIGDDFCYSDLVRLESRIRPVRQHDVGTLNAFDLFFNRCVKLDLDTAVYDLATDLRATHGLKTPDAIHLAAALTHGCEEFWTNDLRLARATSALAFRTF